LFKVFFFFNLAIYQRKGKDSRAFLQFFLKKQQSASGQLCRLFLQLRHKKVLNPQAPF
jgi:hypothetical protein